MFTADRNSVRIHCRGPACVLSASLILFSERNSTMEKKQLPDFINDLLIPEKYGQPLEEISLVQTHISYVILAKKNVYKFKKPVNFGFLDFSTLDKREHYCRQELILNRRLCPDIYLETVTVNKEDGGYRLNGEGELVEHGIKMVRMDESAMMGKVITEGRLVKEHIDAITEVLVPFYETAEGGDAIRKFGLAESVGVNVLENFEQTEEFIGKGALSREQFDLINDHARSVLAESRLFLDRIEAGKIRDCHGDLYSANICLDDSIHIFDCIEFNERFRYSDVAADVAFLAMDLDFHGLEELSLYFLRRFSEVSNDPGILLMADFYKCYRAYVRGKINLFTAADPAVDKQTADHCRTQAKRYFELAEKYVRKAQ